MFPSLTTKEFVYALVILWLPTSLVGWLMWETIFWIYHHVHIGVN